MLSPAQFTNLLDALGTARSAEAAFGQIDAFRQLLAGPGICSINLNVTTRDDPRNEIQLKRLFSSIGGTFPVEGRKRKLRTAWTETLFLRGQVFIAEGPEVLERTFDDYALMRPLGLAAAVNVPLMQANRCYATFNVFSMRRRWQPEEVVGLRLLALAAARWVDPVPALDYAFDAEVAPLKAQAA
jgi:hypothetical protein